MGADDRDEGHAPGECVEHDFQLAGLTLTLEGAYTTSTCTRCGATSIETPDQISGRAT